MRARAQKKKKAPSEVAETAAQQTPAAENRQPTAVESPQSSQLSSDVSPQSHADESSQPSAALTGGDSNRRVIPDPQGPPVVAPVLMPAVVLSDREGVAAAAVATVEAVGVGAIAPVAEALMSAAPPRPSTERQGDARSPAERRDAQSSVERSGAQTSFAATPRDATADDAVEDETWRARDEARLLVQTPRRLYLYWRFAHDPRELLRAALGLVADRLGPAVRLVDEATGDEGAPAPAEGGDYWFDVLPGRLLRAEVGFHGEGLPFVRLISSNTVETPAGGVSRVADEAPEFRVGRREFERVLEATGFAADAWQAERADDPVRPFDPDRLDAARADDPLRARASSDTARRATSPRDGAHFSSPRDGSHFSNTRGDESNGQIDESNKRGGGEVF